ncbi:hypothetical protein CDL15_Pgr014595 [Punica granatum]|uniref:Uncharacterized protein n=1 Tax=Punica granatum TaxID=22663 RepID=A0A218WFC4_PUNGR|nr:hypothetical protein CDL15_Pgr014595 [Punica granatum]
MGERGNHYHKPHAGTRWGGGVRGLSDYRGAIFTIHTSVIRIGSDQVVQPVEPKIEPMSSSIRLKTKMHK